MVERIRLAGLALGFILAVGAVFAGIGAVGVLFGASVSTITFCFGFGLGTGIVNVVTIVVFERLL